VLDILTSQHNEYKPIFADTLYVLQYLMSGHINFAVLSSVGDLFVLPLFVVLYLMWAGDSRAIRERLLLFVPVSWVLFQLQYYSLLSWPGSTLQNIPVVLFSLLTIYLLGRDEQWAFCISLGSLSLAVASSGNGFFVIPIGCLMLIQFRRSGRLVYWLSTFVAMLALYFYKYNFHSGQARADHSVVSSLFHISPLYALSFLGASIARYGSYVPAAILGGCLCALFAYAVFDRLYASRPAMFYSICFILTTAVAVSGLRSDFGIAQSLVSRYRIYSNLLLILFYLYGIGKMGIGTRLDLKPGVRIRSVVTAMAIMAIGFNIASNYAGFKLLRSRTELTKEGMCRWERGEQSITTTLASASEDPVIRRQQMNGNYTPEGNYLREASQLRIYVPPPYCRSNP
jgi:hypothetical protein